MVNGCWKVSDVKLNHYCFISTKVWSETACLLWWIFSSSFFSSKYTSPQNLEVAEEIKLETWSGWNQGKFFFDAQRKIPWTVLMTRLRWHEIRICFVLFWGNQWIVVDMMFTNPKLSTFIKLIYLIDFCQLTISNWYITIYQFTYVCTLSLASIHKMKSLRALSCMTCVLLWNIFFLLGELGCWL